MPPPPSGRGIPLAPPPHRRRQVESPRKQGRGPPRTAPASPVSCEARDKPRTRDECRARRRARIRILAPTYPLEPLQSRLRALAFLGASSMRVSPGGGRCWCPVPRCQRQQLHLWLFFYDAGGRRHQAGKPIRALAFEGAVPPLPTGGGVRLETRPRNVLVTGAWELALGSRCCSRWRVA